MLELRNPHSILAALEARPAAVRSVNVSSRRPNDAWEVVVSVAQQNRIPVSVGGGRKQNRRGTERVGAGSATVEPPSPIPIEQLLQKKSLKTSFGLWLALDQIQDPQNLGAIFRLAGFFNVQGIVMTRDRSAPVNATTCDIAAGGTEYVPFSLVPNLSHAFGCAQKEDIWVLGTCERAENSIHDQSADRHWMLTLGNEGDGMRRLTRDKCDVLCSLPPLGPVPSLNVATAAAACLTVLTAPASR